MEGFSAILIFVVVTLVGALIFGVWLIMASCRLVFRVLRALGSQPPSLPDNRRHADDCDAVNPSDATFCRRCGRRLRAERSPMVRRVAMW